MSKSVNDYIHAATRDNTRKSYRSAIEHYESTWGGFLPATADSIARYLAEHAENLSINTLRQRLAALSAWHREQGFADPTKAPHVKKVLKGISQLHPKREKRAKPLGIKEIAAIVEYIDAQMLSVNNPEQRRLVRDKAILLIGFWRAFRSDELANLLAEHIDVFPGEGMTFFLASTKGDRSGRGVEYRAPALKELCPVEAYQAWIHIAHITEGPVFRKINRWGHIGEDALHPTSIIGIIRALCEHSGIENSSEYSSHSLRRGFANWANDQRWNVKELMAYVGWKDFHSAMRYLDSPDPFHKEKIELGLQGDKGLEHP
ncbi:site-specific integrase [Marinibactrum halimedae]|uniref:Recombinase n=1 Tax=Marinibactrum halimedae TaxID=1444977 RepID=A0AA37T7H0_9GAMM|nr:site-specific integrase [Marinibactrum halimedae]MCD9460723.1 site-specific integrase [Marinibactrum halimedae]GLS25151.1 recombinase [Marinibactrum halimedae]